MNQIIIIFILILVIYFLYEKNNEKYTGAFIQLYSKDYEDSYLTGNPYMYNRHYRYNRYNRYNSYNRYSRHNPFFWNAPTRFNRNSAPYLLLTPERFLLH